MAGQQVTPGLRAKIVWNMDDAAKRQGIPPAARRLIPKILDRWLHNEIDDDEMAKVIGREATVTLNKIVAWAADNGHVVS